MDEKELSSYNMKRKAIIKEFNAKKRKSIIVVLTFAVLALAVAAVIAFCFNISVGIVLGMMVTIFSVIMVRVKIVTANHSLEAKLRYFEDNYE